MKYNQTLVKKRTRITHKADMSLLTSSLIN